MQSDLTQQILSLKDGDHLCLFYERDPSEQMPALVPFIQDGLSNDEQFIYIADDQTVEELTERLHESGINVAQESRRGALNLWTRREWRQPGKLSSKNKSFQVRQLLEEAARAGFKGSRFAVEMTWALGPDIEPADLEHWEATLNNIFVSGVRGRIACQYNRSRLSPEVLLAAFRTHPIAVLGDQVSPNWFYEAPLVLGEKSDAARVEWMISVLERSRRAQKQQEELLDKKIALIRAEIAKAEIENILSLMPTAVYRCDTDGRITYFNRRAAEIWGREPLLNDENEKYCGSTEIWACDRTPLAPAETPTALVTASGTPLRNQHLIFGRPDGTRIIARVNVDPLFGPSGELRGTLNVFDDITDAERGEEASRRLAAIVESSHDAILSKDLDGVIMSWNQGAERLFGYSAGEVIGHSITLMIPPERHDEETEILARIRRGDRVEHYETERLRKDGSAVLISLTVSPLRNAQGRVIGASTIARDITEKKKAEADLRQARDELTKANEELEQRVQLRTAQLERAHAAILRDFEEQRSLEEQLRQAQKFEGIGTLAGGIAHDFNNILNIIRAYTSVIAERISADEKTADDLKTINDAVNRGASVVRQLLTLARKSEPVLAPVDPNEVISSLVSLLRETFPKTISIAVEPGPAAPILADANQITQGLLNLSVNARDAMPEGGNLTLRTQFVGRPDIKNANARERDYVRIDVIDTGVGIDTSIRNRIFDPFFTTKKIGEGTGLGLAMVYGMVQNHNGFITLESELGRGTTFSIYLPVASGILESASANNKDREAAKLPILNGHRTVLVAEDEEPMLMLLESALSRRGYKVLVARDGAEAVHMFDRHKDVIDIVMLDIGLPKMDGWDVVQRLREGHPPANVIITSGYVDPEFKTKLLETGVKRFLDKPYTMEAVAQTLHELIESSAAEASPGGT